MRQSLLLSPTDYIHFDSPVVAEDIKSKGEYKKDNVTVKRWGEETSGEKKFYLLQANDKAIKFTGIVNPYFEREGYGINEHDNGDKYFGYYKNDVRNGHGIYSFKPKKKGNELLSEFYYGFWKTDLKNGQGIYLWLREDASKKPFSDFDNANFQAFVGELERDLFKKGTLLSKEGENYLVYHGPFDIDGNREGQNCFFYNAALEELCFGEYLDDHFIKGYVAHFDEEGNVNDFLKYAEQSETFDVVDMETISIERKAINKRRSRITTIHLDDNFDIQIKGGDDRILRGYDEDAGMFFYKLYFETED